MTGFIKNFEPMSREVFVIEGEPEQTEISTECLEVDLCNSIFKI